MKKMSYEEALSQLKAIVEKLESGGVSLEESIKLYEEGAQLAVFCRKRLDEAKQKITDISALNEEQDHEEQTD